MWKKMAAMPADSLNKSLKLYTVRTVIFLPFQGENIRGVRYLRGRTAVAGRTLATFPAFEACFTRPLAARPAAPNIFNEWLE